jgi:uncharacterized membrane protein
MEKRHRTYSKTMWKLAAMQVIVAVVLMTLGIMLESTFLVVASPMSVAIFLGIILALTDY